MSVLATIENIKIPYPSEGVIRTAQLDDTVAPENSVQLAVNMNFDRVGAIQTRPGITQYADNLVEQINNFGTLRNSIIPAGYAFLFQYGTTQEINPISMNYVTAVKISAAKIAVFWTGDDGLGYCRNFSVDTDVGTVTPMGSVVTFDSTAATQNKAVLVNSTFALCAWQRGTGLTGGGYARAFDISGETIVPKSTAYNFDSVAYQMGLSTVDNNHVICFYAVTAGFGLATAFEINLSTGAVTEPGSDTNWGGSSVFWNSTVMVNGTHFLNAYTDSGTAKAQVFSVNTSTWAITAIGSPLSIAAGFQKNHLVAVGDGSHFIDFGQASSVFVGGQTLAVNLSTFAVTAVGTPLPNSLIGTAALTFASLGDGAHFLSFYSNGGATGHAQMIAMDGSFNLTFVANNLYGYDFGDIYSTDALPISSNQVLVVWGGAVSSTGRAAFFHPYGAVVNGRWLYAAHGDEVSNTTNGTWTSRASGLAEVSKPRFSQFLNYIWMVNGNPQIGGNQVLTSNGGNFGGDLVPANFPGGDFIQAGFEGRVWVANKTLGTIYYTDIVQFVPPATFILTYNPDVNFISQLTPQTGQSITALYRVPRALLVFTEDSIFRIYGASSVDAYPAYNVGTFSQESIIETKTGIFFHHSSGFYQFDYGSQPVEISRRIIDFVQAIPRANYDDITGVYDGFDCVEWSIGQVTVEGVVFVNCMVRYTISTQVWTIYDYPKNVITAMIFYDDGTNLNHLAGVVNTVSTAAYKTGSLDTGVTDFGQPFYFEYIDRWRAFTSMYYLSKSASGFNVYSENAAGANLTYQKQKSGPNAWIPIGTVTEANNAIMPNSGTEDFDVMRLRLAGNTKGAQVVIHGIEVTQLTIKGQDTN